MTMLQGLVRYYERLEGTGLVAPPGYSEKDLSFSIVLARNGEVVDVRDLRDHDSGQKPRLRRELVPAPPADRSGKKRVSAFLWDNSKYALGVGRSQSQVILTPDQFQEFKRFHLGALESAEDPQLVALRLFLASWTPEMYESLRYNGELLETTLRLC